jgi:hypothetical protein
MRGFGRAQSILYKAISVLVILLNLRTDYIFMDRSG